MMNATGFINKENVDERGSTVGNTVPCLSMEERHAKALAYALSGNSNTPAGISLPVKVMPSLSMEERHPKSLAPSGSSTTPAGTSVPVKITPPQQEEGITNTSATSSSMDITSSDTTSEHQLSSIITTAATSPAPVKVSLPQGQKGTRNQNDTTNSMAATKTTTSKNYEQYQTFIILFPTPGPLGLSIHCNSKGKCVVISSEKSDSLKKHIKPGDIIEAINGTDLPTGKTNFISFIQSTSDMPQRQLRIRRQVNTEQVKQPQLVVAQKPPPMKASPKFQPVQTSKSALSQKVVVKKKKKKKIPPLSSDTIYEDPPDPGFVCKDGKYYSTLNNETLTIVSAKLGCEWRDIACMKKNKSRYGKVQANSRFKTGTLLAIPKTHSKWKIKSLFNKQKQLDEKLAICMSCKKKENPNDPNDPPMLMCDGCDNTCHLGCAHLSEIPQGDWFCSKCLDILRARTKVHGKDGTSSLRATLPPLPAFTKYRNIFLLRTRLNQHLLARQEAALDGLKETHRIVKEANKQQLIDLPNQIRSLRNRLEIEKRARTDRLANYGLVDFSKPPIGGEGEYSSDSWIDIPRYGKVYRLRYRCESSYSYHSNTRRPSSQWLNVQTRRTSYLHNEYNRQKEQEIESLRAELVQSEENLALAKQEVDVSSIIEITECDKVTTQYTSMIHGHLIPEYLGMISVENDTDVNAVNMLYDDELVIFLPMVDDEWNDKATIDITVGATYAAFARSELFDAERDDELSISRNGVRDAQRILMKLLMGHPANVDMIVSKPQLPSSVRVRGSDENNVQNNNEAAKLFDLSELVRDCNCDLDLPQEATPSGMSENGLELRDYQKASLYWMLEKERNQTGMGFAGELFHRLQFLDSNNRGHYFYCELTGSLSLDIFDYRSDSEESSAAANFVNMPSGGILGEEMGLGKTMICLALTVANPPKIENQVLKREHLWQLEKHNVSHPEYVRPPSVLGAFACSSSKETYLSNGTLVVVPMTLISQWESEIERYTPWLSVMTLHNAENPTVQKIASTDIVIVSTFLLQKGGGHQSKQQQKTNTTKKLLSMIRKCHWHRIFVDESHYNQNGSTIKTVLASLSASFRYCVTGTPIGHSLDDLSGQLTFLRVPLMSRSAFWTNNISDPFHEHSFEALRVLRSLLSHVVVRHSKEQTLANGNALLALPPRNVETELLEFGSEAERDFYNAIEKRNKEHFLKLRHDGAATVSSKFIDLTGMLYSARQACSHISMVDLKRYDNTNRRLQEEKGINKTKPKTAPKTRSGVLANAMQLARPSAIERVRYVILQFQHGDTQLLECPICLEVVGEVDLAVTPCGHPYCRECIVNVLDAASSTREASGKCPQCRDTIKKSELIFLGDAKDAGTLDNTGVTTGTTNNNTMDEEDKKPAAICTTTTAQGFQITSTDVKVSSHYNSSTLRSGCIPMNQQEENKQLRLDQAYLPTLDKDFLLNYYKCENTIGTKISRLLIEINNMIQRDDKSKCVVFSQFLGILDTAATELTTRGIGFVRVDGNKKQHERADALLDFSSNPTIKVFLLSMRAGAVGLTLTAADHCFILDAPQNSAVEEQAIDRIHRIGQLREVTVKRFIMQGTVEERILQVRRSIAADGNNNNNNSTVNNTTVAATSTGGSPATITATAGTNICGTQILADEESIVARPAKKAKHGPNDSVILDERRQNRVDNLEILFGCESKKIVKG